MVYVDSIICNGIKACVTHGICISICAMNAVENIEDKPVINDNCVECGLCVMNCPREAIKL